LANVRVTDLSQKITEYVDLIFLSKLNRAPDGSPRFAFFRLPLYSGPVRPKEQRTINPGQPMNNALNRFTHNTALLTVLAMLAFAANSLLCRLALGPGLIDAASFATVRIFAGALVLALFMAPVWKERGRLPTDWRAVISLFLYMVFFSYAYRSLSAATGALILFGAVQLTMFFAALRAGERFVPLSWAGLLLAIFGLVYLVLPGVTAPDPIGAALMTVAGIAWGFYSLLGKQVVDPLEATANNFLFSLPLACLVSLIFIESYHVSGSGIALAAASGAIASGMGYVIWYAALRGLTASRAATVQLSVPAIAAFGGAIFLAEEITFRLLLSTAATLGGIALVLAQRARHVS
jgi:drug/metabolite transporter (DMT)-like permease